jgi:hypothetical protein
MRKGSLVLLAVLALILGAAQTAPAATTVLTIKSSLQPQDDGTGAFYDALATSGFLKGQDVHDVIVSGWVNPPELSTHQVQVGLVPHSTYNAYQAGTIPDLWDEGVFVQISLDPGGKHLLCAQDFGAQTDTPARLNGRIRLPFTLTLKPRSGSTGGRALLTVNDDATNLGKPSFNYGKRAAAGERDEDYSEAILVAQALGDGPAGTDLAVKAKQALDSLQILRVTTMGTDLVPRDTFSPGEFVIVHVKYRIVSLRKVKIAYDVRKAVTMFDQPDATSAIQSVGRYLNTATFAVPLEAKPGRHAKVQVSLQLIDRTTGLAVISQDEVTSSITIQ